MIPNELHRAALLPLIGRRLTRIIYGARTAGSPASSVYFFFDDGHCMELFTSSEAIQLAKNVRDWPAEEVLEMFRKSKMQVFEVPGPE